MRRSVCGYCWESAGILKKSAAWASKSDAVSDRIFPKHKSYPEIMGLYIKVRFYRSRQKPRYMKSVKIGSLLFVVFIVSFIPTIYALFSGYLINGYFQFSLYINNLANFFIYLFVDEEFRAKLRTIFKGSQ